MICHLRGKLFSKNSPVVVIDVNGVGYEVQSSMNTIYKLPDLESDVSLFIHMVVREDAQLLFGFYEESERALFREIIKTSGIGPKLALNILSSMDVQTFCQCVNEKNKDKIVGVPGVGKKTAERLIIEMQDRLAKNFAKFMNFNEVLLNNPMSASNNDTAKIDAISALVALGYKQNIAEKVIAKFSSEETDSEALIKLALKHFAN